MSSLILISRLWVANLLIRIVSLGSMLPSTVRDSMVASCMSRYSSPTPWRNSAAVQQGDAGTCSLRDRVRKQPLWQFRLQCGIDRLGPLIFTSWVFPWFLVFPLQSLSRSNNFARSIPQWSIIVFEIEKHLLKFHRGGTENTTWKWKKQHLALFQAR